MGTVVLTHRALVSLSQYFALQEKDWIELLFGKHDVKTPEYVAAWDQIQPSYLKTIQRWLNDAEPARVEAILAEVVRTQGSFRNRVSPRYVYDERYQDLTVCLALEGYIIRGRELLRTEPHLEGAVALEDDLTRELRRSDLSEGNDVIQLLNSSAEDFRKNPPDPNGALTNARVALQTLATSISRVKHSTRPAAFDESKWGQVLVHLRTDGLLTVEEEKGLAGVFTFVSPGAHSKVGLSETEMVRLGRSLAVSMCYFLVKRFNG